MHLTALRAGLVVLSNVLAVTFMVLAVVRTPQDIDATLKEYKVRGTLAGSRDLSAWMLSVSDASSTNPSSPANTTFLAALEGEPRAGREEEPEPGATSTVASAAPAFASHATAPKSSLEHSMQNALAGLTGYGGADELHVLLTGATIASSRGGGSGRGSDRGSSAVGGGVSDGQIGTGTDGDLGEQRAISRAAGDNNTTSDVFALDTLRSICELKRQIETSPGFSRVCQTRPENTQGEGINIGGSGQGHCAPTWSIFDIHALYETLGLGTVLQRFVDVGRMNIDALGVPHGGPGPLAKARHLCGRRVNVHADAAGPTLELEPPWSGGEGGSEYYSMKPPLDSSTAGAELCELAELGCSPEGCSPAFSAESRICKVAGYIEACEWMSAANPSTDDMRILAAVPDIPLDDDTKGKRGVEEGGGSCEGLNLTDVHATLRLGAMAGVLPCASGVWR